MAGIHNYTAQEAENIKIGQSGYKVVATGAHTGAVPDPVVDYYVAVYSYVDATTVTTTSDDTTNYPNLSAVVVPKGTWLYGRWTKVEIGGVGGNAVVYKG